MEVALPRLGTSLLTTTVFSPPLPMNWAPSTTPALVFGPINRPRVRCVATGLSTRVVRLRSGLTKWLNKWRLIPSTFVSPTSCLPTAEPSVVSASPPMACEKRLSVCVRVRIGTASSANSPWARASASDAVSSSPVQGFPFTGTPRISHTRPSTSRSTWTEVLPYTPVQPTSGKGPQQPWRKWWPKSLLYPLR